MSAGDRILEGLLEATRHEENCPRRPGSYTCECGVVVHAPKPRPRYSVADRVALAVGYWLEDLGQALCRRAFANGLRRTGGS